MSYFLLRMTMTLAHENGNPIVDTGFLTCVHYLLRFSPIRLGFKATRALSHLGVHVLYTCHTSGAFVF